MWVHVIFSLIWIIIGFISYYYTGGQLYLAGACFVSGMLVTFLLERVREWLARDD